MSDSNSSTKIGFLGALFLLFLGLRLTDHIDWAWYWIASPFWAPLALVVVLLLVSGVCYGIGSLVGAICAIGKR
jgi:hypothetical protein